VCSAAESNFTGETPVSPLHRSISILVHIYILKLALCVTSDCPMIVTGLSGVGLTGLF